MMNKQEIFRTLTKKEKERYINLFEEKSMIDYLNLQKGKKWVIGYDWDEETDKTRYLLYINYDETTILGDCDYEDELSELGYLMVVYARSKSELVEQAKDFQLLFGNGVALSWGDLAYFSNYFETLGKRYGLFKEFRENGII